MSSALTDNKNKNLSSIKLEAIHQPNASVPALINMADSTTPPSNTTNTNDNNLQKDMLRIPKKERHEIAPPVLEHKLLVKSGDNKISNLLCPIELVLEATNYNAPIIPARYDPDIFCLFHNVTSNSYKATTPKVSSRKRKIDNNHTRNPKKRKKSHHHQIHQQQQEDHDIDLHHKQQRHQHPPSHKHQQQQRQHQQQQQDDDDYFKYQPDLNVNSRPKRQRKKVSYTEPDPNHIPINYVKSKPQTVTKSASKPKQQKPAQQPIQKMERFVEMKWVQCDKCLKWRRIPASISDKELEGEWECKMNKWDLNRNSCDAAEESYDLAEEQTVEVTNGLNNELQQQKRNDFYNILQDFYGSHDMRHKSLNIQQLQQQMIGDKHIDFLQLYLEVTKRGGYHSCIRCKLFDEVFASLQCYQTNQTKIAHQILQNLYSRYLYDYEQQHYDPSKEPSNQPFINSQF